MDNEEFWSTLKCTAIGLLLTSATLLGIAYGSYKYGRFTEQRVLRDTFVEMTQNIYNTGYFDRESHEGVIERWDAEHNFQLGYKKCESDSTDEEEDGRY